MAEYTKAFASSSLAEYGWHSSNATCSQAIINPTLLKILNAERPTHILDLGCGNGSLCRFLHSHGFTVVGMEPDSGGLDIARQKSPHQYLSIKLALKTTLDLSLKAKVSLMLWYQLKLLNIFIYPTFWQGLLGAA